MMATKEKAIYWTLAPASGSKDHVRIAQATSDQGRV